MQYSLYNELLKN